MDIKRVSEPVEKDARKAELNLRINKKLRGKLFEKFKELNIVHNAQETIIDILNELAELDIPTADHSIRVALLSGIIGREMKLGEKGFFISGAIHDVGKLFVPTDILQKKEGFGAADREIMKSHVLKMFERSGQQLPFSTRAGMRHHTFQEDPYPKEMPSYAYGDNAQTQLSMDLTGFIVSISDTFDAAVSRKNDKYIKNGTLSIEQVVSIMLQNYPYFDDLINHLYNSGILDEHIKLIN